MRRQIRIIEATGKLLEEIDKIPAASVDDLALKAAIVKKHLGPEESYYADTALSLADDCIALGASPQTHPDALLISLCDQFIDLELQMKALVGSGMPKQELNVAHDPLELQQAAIGKQIISLRAATSDGAVARAKAAVAWAPDLMDEAGSEGLHSDILRSLFRDLGVAIPPCGTAAPTGEGERGAMSEATKAEARSAALAYCSDFVADWDRVYSIINSLEEAFNAEIAEAKDDQLECHAAEQFSLNLYWLRKQLGASAEVTREKLAAAGYGTGPRA